MSSSEPKPVDTKAFRRRAVAVGISTFVLTGLLATFFASFVVDIADFFTTLFDSGDTPIVLIGGTLTAKAPTNNPKWTQSGTTFTVTPKYAISKIVLKANSKKDGDDQSVADDSSSGSDKSVVDVSNAKSWQVYGFTSSSDNPSVVVTSTPNSKTINLTPYLSPGSSLGYLCPDSKYPKRRIKFGQDNTCTKDQVTFTKIEVVVDGLPNQPLDCKDSNNMSGICRIVFRK